MFKTIYNQGMEYWERVQRRREELGMSREELARAAKLTASYIYRIEKGLVATPSHKTLTALAGALGTSVAELAEGRESGRVIEGMTPDDWLTRFMRQYAPHSPPDLVRQIVSYFDRLDANGRRTAIRMVRALGEGEAEEM